MADHNQKIAAQLQSVSKAFLTMDDDELMSALLDTCSALLDEVEHRRPAVANMGQMERSEYTIGYKLISDLVGHYAQELQKAESINISKDTPVDYMAQLDQMRRDIEAQRDRNQALEAEVEKQRSELKSLCNFYDSMIKMSQMCSPDIIESQKEENRRLSTEVGKQQQALEDINAQKLQQSALLLKIKDQIKHVEDEISRIPDEHKNLIAAYDAKYKELERLQKAQELCSEEKQTEVEQQILALKPTVEKLEQQMNALSGQLQSIVNSRTELDRENQILSTNLLDCIDKAMGELGLAMMEHQQALAEIRHQADTYRNSLAECERLRSGLVQWMGSDRKQFDAALAAIDRQEYTNLKQILDIRTEEHVKTAFTQAGEALAQVDRILAKCAQAAQKDQAIVKRRA